MTRLTLTLLICLALFGTLAFGQSAGLRNNRQKCSSGSRFAKCITKFNGVCGFFQAGKSSSELSRKYSANGCVACSDASVQFWEDGACKAKAGDKIFCDAKLRPEVCTKNYDPVCAYSTDSKGTAKVVRTAGNACSACSDSTVSYFIQGECPTPKPAPPKTTTCNANKRPDFCTQDYTPVCATLNKCANGQKTCTQTFGNGCSACSDTNVKSYVDGECPAPAPAPQQSTTCNANSRPDFCTQEYAPVCATLNKCANGQKTCTQTFGNGCSACSNANVASYVDGECPAPTPAPQKSTTCNTSSRPDLCTLEYAPVCATLDKCANGQKTCTQTFGNGCSACSNTNVKSYVDGECPAPAPAPQKSTTCNASSRPDLCTLEYAPVCATLNKCANGQKTCTQTFGNGCSACSNVNVISYVDGECKN